MLGRSVIRLVSIQCISDASPFAFRSSRRTATVTISAPEASWQRFITSWLGYFPVPMRRREPNRLPAMTSASSMGELLRPSAHERHHLEGVTVPQGHFRMLGLAEHLTVQLHRDTASDAELRHERARRSARRRPGAARR